MNKNPRYLKAGGLLATVLVGLALAPAASAGPTTSVDADIDGHVRCLQGSGYVTCDGHYEPYAEGETLEGYVDVQYGADGTLYFDGYLWEKPSDTVFSNDHCRALLSCNTGEKKVHFDPIKATESGCYTGVVSTGISASAEGSLGGSASDFVQDKDFSDRTCTG